MTNPQGVLVLGRDRFSGPQLAFGATLPAER